MKSKTVVFINGPLHGQFAEIREGNQYEIVQRNDHLLGPVDPDSVVTVPVTKLLYKESAISENVYFLDEGKEKAEALYDQMKAALWYHKSNKFVMPSLPQKILRALAINADIDEAKRKEIIYMLDNI